MDMVTIVKELFGSIKDIPPGAQIAICIFGILLASYLGIIHHLRNRTLFDGRKTRIDKISQYLDKKQIGDSGLIKIAESVRDEQIFAHIFGYL